MSNEVVLRRAEPADAPAIRALTRTAYAKWVPIAGREPKPMIADYDEAVRKHRIDLLQVGVSLVALIELIPGADHLLIENIAVAPAFQGRGFGRQLLAHAEKVAVSLGLGVVRLYTNKLFTGNIQLYLGLGYQIDREEPLNGRTAVHMSKLVRAADGGQSAPARSVHEKGGK